MQPLSTMKAAEPQHESIARTARRDLLDQIADFMMKHDLDVTGVNLAVVTKALSGANAALAQTFAAREIAGDPIDQRWLDTVARLDPEVSERLGELERLMDRMERALMRFSQTARSAAQETCEHRGVIGAQIEQLSRRRGDAGSGEGIDRVIDLSKAMIERIVQVESTMKRSQAESQELRERLARARIEADIDHLTGLPNRRAFERRLDVAARQAVQEGEPLCVAFCDVDNFKSINDTHGHEAGDRVLVAIAETLRRHSSDSCFSARHGGEEFVLLLFGLDKDAAWRRLDGIRRAQAMKRMINRETDRSFGKVTFSAGVTDVRGADDVRAALTRADEALYEAKRTGRNRVVAI